MTIRVLYQTLCLALLTSVTLSGQSGCPPTGSPGSKTATLSIKSVDASCTLENGGFIRADVSYKVHFKAQVSGGCKTFVYQCTGWANCTCMETLSYQRGIGTTYLYDYKETPYSYFQAIVPTNQFDIMSIDTTVPTGTSSTGAGWQPFVEGQHTITSSSGWNQTPCNHQPATFTSDQPFVANVMKCQPKWYMWGTPTLLNMHAPATGEIRIVIPSTEYEYAREPAKLAASAWATGLGRMVTVVEGYGTCDGEDPLCITFQQDWGTRPNEPGCAGFQGSSYTSTGVWTGNGTVRLNPDWKSGHPGVVKRTIAHELGHYFGLGNRDHATCDYRNTIMSALAPVPQGQSPCNSTAAPPSDEAQGPTWSDISALQNSTYGNQVRSTCGW
jgi:hypothetical protein